MEIDTDEIIRINALYNSNLESIENEYFSIVKSVDELKNGWQGEKANKFINAFENEYLKGLKNAIDLLSNYSDYLSKVPGAYELLDESYKNKNIDIK